MNNPRHRAQAANSLCEANVERAADLASFMFVISGESMPFPVSTNHMVNPRASKDMPYLSSRATIGRNSQFYNLTRQDRNEMGGIEYRSLKLLLKVVFGKIFASP